ncbi:hypothetical protein MSG28_005472 [Choristoneura fumiferana]|uniref:Uncharacterized protein n=1 Tax=Choristoneura fumiferana TaxID=7141 RepID=A0ACC0L014_CHOFU|nr:hypothetical protein MSG28_005472 [Choristoneura fumiferana]
MENWRKLRKDFRFAIVGIQVSRIKKRKSAAPTLQVRRLVLLFGQPRVERILRKRLLAQRSQKEDGVNGVTEKSFTKYLFPMYPELAHQFYAYVHRVGKCKNKHIPLAVFRAQCERVLALLDDAAIIETYVRMFSVEEEEGSVSPAALRSLLYTSYKLSMDHYPDGPQTCLAINKVLNSVVNGCFNKKDSHSVGFVVRWLDQHCHRLIFPVHRYCVHMLATRHRDISAHVESDGSGAGLELATPVLERARAGGGDLLPASGAWLLAGTAPPLYSRPLQPPAPPPPHTSVRARAGGGTLASTAWLARLVCALPSHWVPLYASREHGLGANRFLHHTLHYRGPTLVVVAAGGGDDLVVVVACPQEWRETHTYWGGPDCALFQLFPTFLVVEQAAKMLYLNTSIRGYPLGLRAGSDPRKPLLAIDDGFDKMTFNSVPYTLGAIEVWGCGDQASRESQMEVKKWQVKEAERQRQERATQQLHRMVALSSRSNDPPLGTVSCVVFQVKLSAADWIEHPDRYLLELAGRPQYNNSAK